MYAAFQFQPTSEKQQAALQFLFETYQQTALKQALQEGGVVSWLESCLHQ